MNQLYTSICWKGTKTFWILKLKLRDWLDLRIKDLVFFWWQKDNSSLMFYKILSILLASFSTKVINVSFFLWINFYSRFHISLIVCWCNMIFFLWIRMHSIWNMCCWTRITQIVTFNQDISKEGMISQQLFTRCKDHNDGKLFLHLLKLKAFI